MAGFFEFSMMRLRTDIDQVGEVEEIYADDKVSLIAVYIFAGHTIATVEELAFPCTVILFYDVFRESQPIRLGYQSPAFSVSIYSNNVIVQRRCS
jgi:hypothetical protein